jgi:hypothetical protein
MTKMLVELIDPSELTTNAWWLPLTVKMTAAEWPLSQLKVTGGVTL